MAGGAIGSFTIDLKAKITGYEEQIAIIKRELEKVGASTDLGKSLTSQLKDAEKQLAALQKHPTPRISSDSQLTRTMDQLNDMESRLQSLGMGLQSVRVGDLDTSKFGQEIKGMQSQVENLKNSLNSISTDGFNKIINDLMGSKSGKFQEIMDLLKIDPSTLNMGNFEEVFATALENAKAHVEDLKNELANLTNQQKDMQSNFDLNNNIAKNLNAPAIKQQLEAQFSQLDVSKLKENFAHALEGLHLDKDVQQQIQNAFNSINLSDYKDVGSLTNFLQGFFKEQIAGQKGANLSPTQFRDYVGKVPQFFTASTEEVRQQLQTMVEQATGGVKIPDNILDKIMGNFTTKMQSGGASAAFVQLGKDLETFQKQAETAAERTAPAITQIEQKMQELSNEEKRYNNISQRANGAKAQINQQVASLDKEIAEKQQLLQSLNQQIEEAKQRIANGINTAGGGVSNRSAQNLQENNQAAKQYEVELQRVQSAEQMVGRIQGVLQRWFSIYAAVRMVGQAIRSVKDTLAELDKTITEISIVTDMSSQDLWGQMESYTKMAKEYATSISGVYKVSQLYYQQGLQTADVMELTEQTLKMVRISGLDYATATDYMTNAIRSFKMEMSDAQSVVDVYSALAASSASSTSELAVAMSKTASSAQAVGSSFESTAAMMAVMIESTRESATNIGSAMKSIISRYGEMTSNPAAITDSEGEEMSLNRVDKALQTVGITIHDTNGEFREFDDVIMELAEKWDTIDTNTQRYIATIMAGNRQQSRFLALVSNGERLKQLTTIAEESDDTATMQTLKSLDSIDAKKQQLQTSLQDLYTDQGLEKLYKTILDFSNRIVTSLNDINSLPVAIGKIFSQFGSVALTLTTIFTTLRSKFSQQNSLMRMELERHNNEMKAIEDKYLIDLKTAQANKDAVKEQELLAQKKHDQKMEQEIFTSNQRRIKKQKTSGFGVAKTAGLVMSVAGTAFSTHAANLDVNKNREQKAIETGLSGVLQGLGTGFMIGGPVAGTIIGVLTALPGILEAVGMWSESTEEKVSRLADALKESQNKTIASKNELKTLKDYAEQYEKVYKARNENNEAYQTWLDLSNEIANKYPELISGMDAEGNYVVTLTGLYQDLVKIKEQAYKEDIKEEGKKALATYFDKDYVIKSLGIKDIETSEGTTGTAAEALTKYYQGLSAEQWSNYTLSGAISDWITTRGTFSMDTASLLFSNDFLTADSVRKRQNELWQFLGNPNYRKREDLLTNKVQDALKKKIITKSEADFYEQNIIPILQDMDITGIISNRDISDPKVAQLIFYAALARYFGQEIDNNADPAELEQQFNHDLGIDNFTLNRQIFAGQYADFIRGTLNLRSSQGQQQIENYNRMYALASMQASGLDVDDIQSAWLLERTQQQWKQKFNELDAEATQDDIIAAWDKFTLELDTQLGKWSEEFFTQYYQTLTQTQKDQLNQAYKNVGQYANKEQLITDLPFLKNNFKLLDFVWSEMKKNTQTVMDRYTSGIHELDFSSPLQRFFMRRLKFSVPTDYLDDVLSTTSQIIDTSITNDEEQQRIGAYRNLLLKISQIQDPNTRNALFTAITGIENINSISELLEVQRTLEEKGYSEDSEQWKAIQTLIKFAHINPAAEFNTLINDTASLAEAYEKAMSQAAKGMDLKAAMEMADKLDVTLGAFKFKDGKFFFDDYAAIQQAYFGYDNELMQKIQKRSEQWLGVLKHINIQDLVDKNAFEGKTAKDVYQNLINLDIAPEDAQYLQTIYSTYYQAWLNLGENRGKFYDYVKEQLEQEEENLKIITQKYGNYALVSNILSTKGLQAAFEQIIRQKHPKIRDDQIQLLTNYYMKHSDNLSWVPEEYQGLIWDYIHKSSTDAFDAAKKVLEGEGPQKVGITERNWKFLKAIGAQTLGGEEITDKMIGQFAEITSSTIESLEDSLDTLTVTDEQKRKMQNEIHELRYKNKGGNILSQVVESYDSLDRETADAFAKYLGGRIEDFSAMFQLDAGTGKYRIDVNQLRAQIQRDADISQETRNKLFSELDSKERDISINSILQDIISNRTELEEEAISSLATAVKMDYKTFIEEYLTRNADGKYTLSLGKLNKLISDKKINLNSALEQLIDEQFDAVISNVTGLVGNQTKGYTSLKDMREYANKLADLGYIFQDTDKDTIIGDIFTWNDALHAYVMTTNGLSLQMLAAAQALGEYDKDSDEYTAAFKLLQDIPRQVAANIDITGFLSSADRFDTESQAYTTFKDSLQQYMNFMNLATENLEVGEDTFVTLDEFIASFSKGGKSTLAIAEWIAREQGKTLTSEERTQILQMNVNGILSAVEALDGLVAGTVISDDIYAYIKGIRGINIAEQGNLHIVSAVGDLSQAYADLYARLEQDMMATVKQLNDIKVKQFNIQYKSSAFDNLSKAAGMTFEELGNILTEQGLKLTDDFFTKFENIFKIVDGKVQVLDFEAYARAFLKLQPGSRAYTQAFSAYNDAMIALDTEMEKAINDEVSSILQARVGTPKKNIRVNVANLYEKLRSMAMSGVNEQALFSQARASYIGDYAEKHGTTDFIDVEKRKAIFADAQQSATQQVETLRQSLVNSLNDTLAQYGANIQDGMLYLSEYANIPQITREIGKFAQEKDLMLSEDIQALMDSVDELVKGIADSIKAGIEGTLNKADAEQLQVNAKNILGVDLTFTSTADGLKIANQQAIELYYKLQGIDAAAAQIVFDGLKESLTAAGEECENISRTMVEIAKLQAQISRNNKSGINNSDLEERLKLYQEIAMTQMNEPEQYDFMGRKLPDMFQGPLNYWNSLGKMFSAINKAGKSRKKLMGVSDFYDIVNELNNMAAISGQKLNFLGYELNGDMENVSALIQAGFSSLENVDGTGAQINLGKIAVNMEASASNMEVGLDDAIQGMAQSQISMLDGLIALLETIVAMESLGDVAGEDISIDIPDIFVKGGEFIYNGEGYDIEHYNEKYQEWAQNFIAQADEQTEAGKALKKTLQSVSVGNKNLYEIIADATDGVYELELSAEEYQQVMNSFYQMAISGDWDTNDPVNSVLKMFKNTKLNKDIIATVGEGQDQRKVVIRNGYMLTSDAKQEFHVAGGTYNDPTEAMDAYIFQQDYNLQKVWRDKAGKWTGSGTRKVTMTKGQKTKEYELTFAVALDAETGNPIWTVGDGTNSVTGKSGQTLNQVYDQFFEEFVAGEFGLTDDTSEEYQEMEKRFRYGNNIEVVVATELEFNPDMDETTVKKQLQGMSSAKYQELVNKVLARDFKGADKILLDTGIGLRLKFDENGDISQASYDKLLSLFGIESTKKVYAVELSETGEAPITDKLLKAPDPMTKEIGITIDPDNMTMKDGTKLGDTIPLPEGVTATVTVDGVEPVPGENLPDGPTLEEKIRTLLTGAGLSYTDEELKVITEWVSYKLGVHLPSDVNDAGKASFDAGQNAPDITKVIESILARNGLATKNTTLDPIIYFLNYLLSASQGGLATGSATNEADIIKGLTALLGGSTEPGGTLNLEDITALLLYLLSTGTGKDDVKSADAIYNELVGLLDGTPKPGETMTLNPVAAILAYILSTIMQPGQVFSYSGLLGFIQTLAKSKGLPLTPETIMQIGTILQYLMGLSVIYEGEDLIALIYAALGIPTVGDIDLGSRRAKITITGIDATDANGNPVTLDLGAVGTVTSTGGGGNTGGKTPLDWNTDFVNAQTKEEAEKAAITTAYLQNLTPDEAQGIINTLSGNINASDMTGISDFLGKAAHYEQNNDLTKNMDPRAANLPFVAKSIDQRQAQMIEELQNSANTDLADFKAKVETNSESIDTLQGYLDTMTSIKNKANELGITLEGVDDLIGQAQSELEERRKASQAAIGANARAQIRKRLAESHQSNAGEIINGIGSTYNQLGMQLQAATPDSAFTNTTDITNAKASLNTAQGLQATIEGQISLLQEELASAQMWAKYTSESAAEARKHANQANTPEAEAAAKAAEQAAADAENMVKAIEAQIATAGATLEGAKGELDRATSEFKNKVETFIAGQEQIMTGKNSLETIQDAFEAILAAGNLIYDADDQNWVALKEHYEQMIDNKRHAEQNAKNYAGANNKIEATIERLQTNAGNKGTDLTNAITDFYGILPTGDPSSLISIQNGGKQIKKAQEKQATIAMQVSLLNAYLSAAQTSLETAQANAEAARENANNAQTPEAEAAAVRAEAAAAAAQAIVDNISGQLDQAQTDKKGIDDEIAGLISTWNNGVIDFITSQKSIIDNENTSVADANAALDTMKAAIEYLYDEEQREAWKEIIDGLPAIIQKKPEMAAAKDELSTAVGTSENLDRWFSENAEGVVARYNGLVETLNKYSQNYDQLSEQGRKYYDDLYTNLSNARDSEAGQWYGSLLDELPERPTIEVEANTSEADSALDTTQGKVTALAGDYTVNIHIKTDGTVPTITAGAGIIDKGTGGVNAAKGNVALAKGSKTLMGELGPELWVSNGHYYVAGQNGAEFVDLPDDAIVFNHMQTRRLLANGIAGHGKPVVSESAALSYAKGNVPQGPALAGAAAALAALKQIRAMWQRMLDASMKDLGQQAGGGGGGGGGDKNKIDPGYIADLERWYNLLRQIERLEKSINYESQLRNKIQSDLNKNGYAYYDSQKRSLEYLEQQIAKTKELSSLQKDYYNKRREDLARTNYGKIFTFDENGLMQYNDNARMANGAKGGLSALAALNAQNDDGSAVYTAREQYAILEAWGFSNDLKYTNEGKEIEWVDDKGKEREEAYTEAVQAFWDKLDGWKDELDTLYDDYNEKLNDVLEQESARNELLKEMIDNQLSLEESVLKAIEDSRQKEIDALQDERDALEKSTNEFLDGLDDKLTKERDMYQKQEDTQEINKMRRQLAILQRSGGSASQISSLQQQIQSKEQEMYFDAQQEQIGAIREASDLQLERLDTQISILTETLEYQKEHGLLWEKVYEVMSGSAEDIGHFITENGAEWAEKSALAFEQDFSELNSSIEQWIGRRTDNENGKNPFANDYGHNWATYAEGAHRRYSHVWTDANVAAAQKAYDAEYAISADPNRAGEEADKYFQKKLDEFYLLHPELKPQKEVIKGTPAESTSGGGGSGGTATKNAKAGTLYVATYFDEKASFEKESDAKAWLEKKREERKQSYLAENVQSKPAYTLAAVAGFIQQQSTAVQITDSNQKTLGAFKSYQYSQKDDDTHYKTAIYQYGNGKTVIEKHQFKKDKEDDKNIYYTCQYCHRTKTVPKPKKNIAGASTGGTVTDTGLVLLHGSKVNPEGVLNPEQTRVLREQILSNRPTSLLSQLSTLRTTLIGAGDINANSDSGINIDKIEVNMNVASIANDYDARRAGEQALEEMVRIARKTGTQGLRR